MGAVELQGTLDVKIIWADVGGVPIEPCDSIGSKRFAELTLSLIAKLLELGLVVAVEQVQGRCLILVGHLLDIGNLRYAAGSDRLNTTAKRALNRRTEGPAVLPESYSREIY